MIAGPWKTIQVRFSDLEDTLNSVEEAGYEIVKLSHVKLYDPEVDEEDEMLVVAREGSEEESIIGNPEEGEVGNEEAKETV